MSVVSVVVGAATPDGATFVAKVDGGGPVRVAVATDEAMTSPVFTASQAVDAQGVAKVSITGLDPATRYWWQVEDNSVLDTSVTGQFRTAAPAGAQASFTIGMSSCAGLAPVYPATGSELAPDRLSNHPVFDTIRQRALDEEWALFAHMGDLHYYDLGSDSHGIVGGGSLGNYRTAYDDVLAQSNQAALYREVPWVSVWDDHDYGPNNSDGTYVDKANAAAVFRERVPHHPLGEADAIYRAWQIGRVQFILSDTRFHRSPNTDPDGPSKTMLGTAQKTWMRGVLETSDAEFLIWLCPTPWITPQDSTTGDTWAGYGTERDEVAAMFADTGWAHRMVMAYGDTHQAGINSGATNHWGGFPVLMAGSLDSSFSEGNPALFDVLSATGGRSQYGTITVSDLGNIILIRLAAFNGTTELGSYAFGVTLGPATVTAPDALTRTLTGSHRPVFEARVVTSFQTGDDPDGEQIPILGGDVIYDATADVFASLQLDTTGGNGKDSLFPRHAADPLAPYGNEIFVRRGVDVGTEIVWVPLGYFRIETAEQSGGSYDPVRIGGQDRMSGIIDGRLVSPRQFTEDRTAASVVNELVHEIYPDAIVTFDGGGSSRLGRSLVVEEDRYEAIQDIANSLGKIVYWDGTGILRIEDPPDLDVVTWVVNAGRGGVQTNVNRSLTRDGFYNAVVARGEGSTESPVQAVAVDDGPSSPTRWGGRFGKVPRFYSSPLLTTGQQARTAARSLLSRYIGMPYSVSFGSIPNPALRPRDVIRVVHLDGNREKHVVDSCTIPLTAGVAMTGNTRVHTQARIGELT